MPTTRRAAAAAAEVSESVRAAALVRFDSTVVELEPAVEKDAPTGTRSKATKRKVVHVTNEEEVVVTKKARGRRASFTKSASDVPQNGVVDDTTKGKGRKRKGAPSNSEALNGADTSNAFIDKLPGILKPARFERTDTGSLDAPAVPAPPSPSDALPPTEVAKAAAVAAASGPQTLVPAVLTFDLSEAKQHLTAADRRFGEIFAHMKCRPFENLERVDPFRTLVQSILGQQISWLAARSIIYKFIRLFNPSLPEKRPDDGTLRRADAPFPTAAQVAGTPAAVLRTAGLSMRKVEYVQDLAARFADGRLSTTKLLEADDEELASMLIEVRGIGRWTVDMFAMFSLRRPDILPVGDLGVQRGLLRWCLSLHDPTKHKFSLAPEKLPKGTDDDDGETVDDQNFNKGQADGTIADASGGGREAADAADPGPSALKWGKRGHDFEPEIASTNTDATLSGAAADASSVPPAPPPTTPARRGRRPLTAEDTPAAVLALPALPTPFTASIERTLAGMDADPDAGDALPAPPVPLPAGLNVATLRARLEGKKKIKGGMLTPEEMEQLTEGWRPYRSLGVYYMWALADQEKEGNGK